MASMPRTGSTRLVQWASPSSRCSLGFRELGMYVNDNRLLMGTHFLLGKSTHQLVISSFPLSSEWREGARDIYVVLKLAGRILPLSNTHLTSLQTYCTDGLRTAYSNEDLYIRLALKLDSIRFWFGSSYQYMCSRALRNLISHRHYQPPIRIHGGESP